MAVQQQRAIVSIRFLTSTGGYENSRVTIANVEQNNLRTLEDPSRRIRAPRHSPKYVRDLTRRKSGERENIRHLGIGFANRVGETGSRAKPTLIFIACGDL